MKKTFFLLLLLFTVHCFAFDISSNAEFNSIYTDDTGSAFIYDGKAYFCTQNGENSLFLSAGYQGATSSLEMFNGTAHNAVISAGIRTNEKNFAFGFTLGGIPQNLNFSFDTIKISLTDLSFYTGFINFSTSFAKYFSFSIKLFGGTEKTSSGDLYLIKGTINAPFFCGGIVKTEFPFEIYSTLLYTGTVFSLQNNAEKHIGEGNISLFYASAGKKWIFDNKAKHLISCDGGFLYLWSSGTATPENSQNYILFPFSYMHANGNLSCYSFTASGRYDFLYNCFKLSTRMGIIINIYSDVNYFYKYTYKKNIFFDGSTHRSIDSFSFSNGDFITFADINCSYTVKIANKAVDFFLHKTVFLPVLSENTKDKFGIESRAGFLTPNERLSTLKTILLSGLSFGIKIIW